MRTDISLELAARLSEQVNEAFADGSMLEAVTPITAELLKYWFCEPYTTERKYNFHIGQRQSILNIIYLHEVLGVKSVVFLRTHCIGLPKINLLLWRFVFLPCSSSFPCLRPCSRRTQ